MNAPDPMPTSNHRREILRTCLRGGGLIALGGVASLLGWRSARGNCVRKNPCGACPLFSACDLPKAQDAKTPKPKSDHG